MIYTWPWNVLEIEPTASKTEIKKAYRQLVKENHPDVGGDPAKCAEINEAYKKALEYGGKSSS